MHQTIKRRPVISEWEKIDAHFVKMILESKKRFRTKVPLQDIKHGWSYYFATPICSFFVSHFIAWITKLMSTIYSLYKHRLFLYFNTTHATRRFTFMLKLLWSYPKALFFCIAAPPLNFLLFSVQFNLRLICMHMHTFAFRLT